MMRSGSESLLVFDIYRLNWLAGETYGCAVVPESNIILVPLETGVHFLCCGDHVGKVFQDGITLGLGNANDLGHETRVEE